MLSSPTAAAAAPLFKTLSRDECESVLLRNNVGTIAFALGRSRGVIDRTHIAQAV